MSQRLHEAPSAQEPTLEPHHHAAHNGIGVFALLSGSAGVVCGAIPFLFPLAALFGVVALVAGTVAWRRLRTGRATDGRSVRAALMLGVLALVLAAAGLVVTLVATDELSPPPQDLPRSGPAVYR